MTNKKRSTRYTIVSNSPYSVRWIGSDDPTLINDDENNPRHIQRIMQMFDRKEEVAHIATTIDNSKIAENDYNLSISSYVEPKDTHKKIDIEELNKEIAATVSKIDTLRTDIDKIVKEIEG